MGSRLGYGGKLRVMLNVSNDASRTTNYGPPAARLARLLCFVISSNPRFDNRYTLSQKVPVH